MLNRAVARLTIFEKPGDDAAFMRVLDETWPLPIFAMVAIIADRYARRRANCSSRSRSKRRLRGHTHTNTHTQKAQKGSGLFDVPGIGLYAA